MKTARTALADELAALAAAGRLRRRTVVDAVSGGGRIVSLQDEGRRQRLINWAANDYLGLAHHLRVRNAASRAARAWGGGATSARLLAGGTRLHRRLEENLAAWLGCDDVLLTTTGYQANLAAISVLADHRDDVVVLDRLCHASLYDGARLSAGRLVRFRHNDAADLDRHLAALATCRRRVVAVESVYSMDGDEAPLAAIAAACRRHDALLVVDEAHALGLFGPAGRGCCAEVGIRPDLLVGTCSKALGAQGGLLAGDRTMVDLLVNRARSFVFTTAAAPAVPAAAGAALSLVRQRPERAADLLTAAADLRRGLRAQGWAVPEGRSPIVPVIVGDEAAALDLAARLRTAGHYAPAIRPPTVPPGTCRLRFSLSAVHTPADRRRLLASLAVVASDFLPARPGGGAPSLPSPG